MTGGGLAGRPQDLTPAATGDGERGLQDPGLDHGGAPLGDQRAQRLGHIAQADSLGLPVPPSTSRHARPFVSHDLSSHLSAAALRD
jgi:hypothetical protein